jgi:hypothetical protein
MDESIADPLIADISIPPPEQDAVDLYNILLLDVKTQSHDDMKHSSSQTHAHATNSQMSSSVKDATILCCDPLSSSGETESGLVVFFSVSALSIKLTFALFGYLPRLLPYGPL